jgi:hypothetical protein
MVGMILPEAPERGGISGLEGFEEVFGLFPELLQIRTRRKRLGHVTFLLEPEIR